MLCSLIAMGQALLQLIVFSKCLQTLQGFAQQGQINASCSFFESDLVDQDIYTE